MLPESTPGAGGRGGGGRAGRGGGGGRGAGAGGGGRAAARGPPGSLEYRAGLQALALTVHLAEDPDRPPAGRIDEWLWHTAYDRPWPPWVEERLAERRAAGGDGPDLALAHTAWRRLRDTWIRAADLDGREDLDPECPVDEAEQIWLPAWKLGLPLAHLSLHLH
ncbi:hypothetical protein ACFQ7A_04485 [Streptomyces sp. NPDC056528]|uniref:hypothetical protein n=1 Tax=Streptomyces sp. NPDC056528 TaxID=3345854 RepID=UPI003698539B